MKTEEAFENGFDSRARKKTAPFLVWIGEKEAFENGDEKGVIFCRIYQRFRLFLVLAIGDNESVWTDKNKTKTLVWSKIFGFVYGHSQTESTGPAHTRLPRFQKVLSDRKRFQCLILPVIMSRDMLSPNWDGIWSYHLIGIWFFGFDFNDHNCDFRDLK